ncbi:MAG: response regulator [Alphaproteobacteria bacterium]|nr:response regulator [Alphaproteobacteria bacterium]
MEHAYIENKVNNQSMVLSAQNSGSTHEQIVYLVDDDLDDRMYGAHHLQKSDHIGEIRPVESADALFKYFKKSGIYENTSFASSPTPIIILDIHMPAMNGIEVLDRIRNHPITSDFPVILLTTDVSCEKVYDAYRFHANGYLQKPLDLCQFHKVMEQIATGEHKVYF